MNKYKKYNCKGLIIALVLVFNCLPSVAKDKVASDEVFCQRLYGNPEGTKFCTESVGKCTKSIWNTQEHCRIEMIKFYQIANAAAHGGSIDTNTLLLLQINNNLLQHHGH